MMSSVNESTDQVAQGSQNLSSITEEISDSSQEMSVSVNKLSYEADEVAQSSNEIKKCDANIKQKASKSLEDGKTIYDEKKKNITKAIEDIAHSAQRQAELDQKIIYMINKFTV